jgi:putative ABC transport system permease protein
MHGLKKVYRDLRVSWGRSLTLILSVTVGATAFFATYGAYGTLTREIQRAYLDTIPASATLDLSNVSREVLEEVRRRPEVAAATRRKTLHGRFRLTPQSPWGNAIVFVADDFHDAPLARVAHERGEVAPTERTVLIERSALPVLGGDIGTRFELKLPGGRTTEVDVSGVVHEAALAPANTHASVYLYATPALARALGDDGSFDELRVLVAKDGHDKASIERTAQALGTWLTAGGLATVHEIRVPPPARHPHQTQLTTVLALLLIFSGLVFVMSTLLAASILSAMLARQIREMGVLKTLGATGSQLTSWYVLAMVVLSTFAVGLAWPTGALGAQTWTLAVARMLNFDVQSNAPPGWVSATAIVAALSAPVLVTLPSILRATRVPVLQTLQDFGLGNTATFPRNTALDGLFRRASRASLWLPYALRNVLRQRSRLLLAVALFAVSGGITIAAFSVGDSWAAWSERLRLEQDYDLEVVLVDSTQLSRARTEVSLLASVAAVEAWGAVPTSFVGEGAFAVRNTYPDDAHGAFTLMAPPTDTAMLRVEPTDGRWLSAKDTDGIVLNQLVPGQARIELGATVSLAIEGVTHGFLVVGKVEQVGVGATAYVSPTTLARLVPASKIGGRLRVRGNEQSARHVAGELPTEVERRLAALGSRVVEVVPLGVYENAMVAHFEILMKALLALAALTALVGALGLSSSVAVGVLERTRELGVLRAIGASGTQVRNIVLAEGVLVGAFSLVIACGLGLALAWGLGTAIGLMSFALPLPLRPNYGAAAAWALAVVTLSALASALPATRAARLSVREAINHV